MREKDGVYAEMIARGVAIWWMQRNESIKDNEAGRALIEGAAKSVRKTMIDERIIPADVPEIETHWLAYGSGRHAPSFSFALPELRPLTPAELEHRERMIAELTADVPTPIDRCPTCGTRRHP